MGKDYSDLAEFVVKEKEIRKKKNSHKTSRLRKYLVEIVTLRDELNASWPIIQAYLQKKRRIKMSEEGIRSYYNRHKDELNSTNGTKK